MTEAEAQARLEHMVASREEPTLTAQEIADLLSMCKLADSAGLAPSDADWEPTGALNRGAAEGWRSKMAKIAGRFDFSADGASFQRSQVAEHCLEMANRYKRSTTSNILISGSLATEA